MKSRTGVKIIVGLLILSVISLFVFGCSSGQKKDAAAASGEKKYDVLRIPTPAGETTSTVLYWVGEEKGFFDEQGIKLEYVGVVPQTQVVASVVAGKIDVGGMHVNRMIAGISAGAKIKAVVAQTETTKEIPHRTYLTRKDSSIYTPQDVLGKKMAIAIYGGCHEYIPYGWMHYVGGIADPRGKFELVVMPETMMEQALRQGVVDVAAITRFLPADIPNRAELKDFRYLFSDYEVWGTIAGGTPLYFQEKFIKEKPDVVRRFVTAMANTIHWQNEHKQEAAEITAKRGNVDPKTVKIGSYAADGIIKEETIKVWIDMLTEFEEIKPGMKPEQIYTNEFNPYWKR